MKKDEYDTLCSLVAKAGLCPSDRTMLEYFNELAKYLETVAVDQPVDKEALKKYVEAHAGTDVDADLRSLDKESQELLDKMQTPENKEAIRHAMDEIGKPGMTWNRWSEFKKTWSKEFRDEVESQAKKELEEFPLLPSDKCHTCINFTTCEPDRNNCNYVANLPKIIDSMKEGEIVSLDGRPFSKENLQDIQEGLEDVKAGRIHDLGDFSKYVEEGDND